MLLAVLGARTFRHSGIYVDGETIYRDTLRHNPVCWMAYNNLRIIVAKMPARLPEAIADYEAANALMTISGRAQEAVSHLNKRYALARMAIMHYNLGVALASMPGHLPEAISKYQTELRINLTLLPRHFNMGTALAQIPGRLGDTIVEYRAALRITPAEANTHYSLGFALSKVSGRLDAAIADFADALHQSGPCLGADSRAPAGRL